MRPEGLRRGAHIPLERLALLFYDAGTAEYTELGSSPYLVNLELDRTQRRDDGALGNDVGLVVDIPRLREGDASRRCTRPQADPQPLVVSRGAGRGRVLSRGAAAASEPPPTALCGQR